MRPTSLLLLLAASAQAEVPLATYPDCGEPDRPDLCPADLGESWDLVSYVRDEWTSTVRADELPLGTGLWADRAWRTSTGRTDVVIAVLDSGIEWDDGAVRRKHFLNTGELPVPRDADGVDAPDHDLDGNGVVNVDDYALDPRVSVDAGVDRADGVLDPSDLIAVFSDGVDDDGNGYIDDVSGWDFFWNDNDPYDDTRYGHGTGEARDSAAEGEDEHGAIGTCPNCMLLDLRVSDSFLADGQSFASAVLYATDMGASVIQEALGTINHASTVADAIAYAWERDVLVVASAADESAYHHNMPGTNARTLYVHAIRYDEEDRDEATSFLAYSNCTNHGARLVLSAPSTSCSSGATGVTSGVAGLVYSAARDAGVALTAAEAWQLLAGTADDVDLTGAPEFDEAKPRWYPSKPGWDRFFGYGRVNAARAVELAAAGEIPPVLALDSPGWFEILDPEAEPVVTIEGLVRADRSTGVSWTLEAAAGDEPDDGDFTTIGSGDGAVEGVLATWDIGHVAGLEPEAALPEYPLDWDQVDREDAVNQFTVTLRLRATDAQGRTSELRRAVYVHHDPDWLEGVPLGVGSSLESSPLLVDLDDDGVVEVVQGDADGRVHAWSFQDGIAELAGWPVTVEWLEETDPDAPANHLDAPAWAVVEPGRASVVSSPAAADLDGDGTVEVVAATLRGKLWVWEADGSVRAGFPVAQDRVAYTDEDVVLDEGFFSSPALGDLDGDGDLEIVVGGMDQQVYAWHDDGSAVDGWPVTPIHPSYAEYGSRIVSSPAVGDLDGDGADDVVIGTNETLGDTYGAVYAIHGQGNGHAGGAVMEGWPYALFGAYTSALPYVGEGVPASPALADMDGDGDLEVAAHTIAGPVVLLHHDGSVLWEAGTAASSYGEGTNVDNASTFPFINSSSIGDLDGDGRPDVVTGAIGSGLAEAMLFDGRRFRIDHALVAWGNDGEMLRHWPRIMEDMQFFMNPAIADLDGDRHPEAVAGSGGFVLHAFDEEGEEPDGWPKFTGQWVLASPAVGDVDGDGNLDVVVGTRSGWLFAWATASPAGAAVEWQSFGHDARNTRNYEAPLDGYNGGYPEADPAPDEAKRCGCNAGVRLGGALITALGVGLLLARRRRAG